MKAIFLGLATGAACAQSLGAEQAVYQIDIDHGALNTALTQFARQTGIQVARFSDNEPTDVLVGPLHGSYSLEQALTRLLAGSGLAFRFVNERTVAIVKATSPEPQTEFSAPQNPEINDVAKSSRYHGWAAPIGAFLAACGSLASTAPACAQDSGDPLAEVVVTGSRVITNGNNSPTPVTVVDAQRLLELQPTTISDGLNLMPVFSGPRNQLSNPNAAIGSGGGGNANASYLNLRNLGPERTLVLLDGHRVPPTTSTGIVDTDMIPQLLLKRVDVVTGGVSAVYGSDAISGVVNFVTDRNFNGLKASAQYGISEQGDGEQIEVGIAGGMSLGSRAHIEGSYEYRDDEGILYRSSRPDIAWQTLQGNGTTIPYFLTGDAVRFDMTYGGKISNGTLANNQFIAGGLLVPQAQGAVTGNNATRLGGDGARYDASLKAPLRSHQLFGRLDYDFTDTLHGYIELAGNQKHNEIFANSPTPIGVTLSSSNAFLATTAMTPAQRTQLAASTTFTFGKMISTAPRLNPQIDEKQISVQTGLDGHLGKYVWDVAYVYGHAVLDNQQVANVNNLRLSAAMDAVTSGSNIVCNAAATMPGCVPLNMFGPGSESAAARDYILGNPTYKATTQQQELAASISGEPFDTWAGPFKTALSAEWRRQDYEAVSSDPPAPVDCTALGLRFNCQNLTFPDPNNPTSTTRYVPQYANSFSSRSPVQQTVSEGALEFDAPLLTGRSLVKSLNLNGAVRYTNYDTSGDYTTWKVGIDWHLNDDWRFRGTRSEDIRAPTLDNLFSPLSGQQVTIADRKPPGTGGSPTVYRFELGNPDLKAEVGDTTTLGIVFQPVGLPGFSTSLDYFNINITDAISQIQGSNPVVQDACYASGGTSPYCALQVRGPTGTILQWYSGYLNISSIKTEGGDLELNYATKLGAHPLALRAMVTYQPHIYYETPGLATVDMGGVAFGPGGLQASPSTRVTVAVSYSPIDKLTIDLLTRWRSSLALTGDPTVITTGESVPSVSYTNLTLKYNVLQNKGNMDVFLNVQNLFDEGAPPANVNTTPTQIGLLGGFAIGDDPVGRFYTAGLRYKF